MITAVEVVATRRYAGYSRLKPGADPDAVALAVADLATEEEAVLRTVFLASLGRLEAAIQAASDTVGTSAAAVWTRNPQEVAERTEMYRAQRIAMCRFLGVEPGPGIWDVAGDASPEAVLPPAVYVVTFAAVIAPAAAILLGS